MDYSGASFERREVPDDESCSYVRIVYRCFRFISYVNNTDLTAIGCSSTTKKRTFEQPLFSLRRAYSNTKQIKMDGEAMTSGPSGVGSPSSVPATPTAHTSNTHTGPGGDPPPHIRCSPRIQKSSMPMVGMTFDTESTMDNFVNQYASENGFSVTNNTNYHNGEKARKLSGGTRDKMLARGYYYCHKRQKSCPFQIKYTYDTEKKQYRLNEVKLDHSAHGRKDVLINGKTYIKHEKDVQPEMHSFFSTLVLAGTVDMPNLKQALSVAFPHVIFETNLIKRVVAKYKSAHFGDDPHRLKDLWAVGDKIRADGGLFEIDVDDSYRVRTIFVQTRTMRLYANLYKDFTILDGTHDTNKYKLVLIPSTNIDCLMRSVVTSFTINRSENNELAKNLMDKCGLAHEGGTLMTDEGSGWVNVASELKMRHALCAHHFREKGVKSEVTAGMSGELKKSFVADYSRLIYDKFDSEDAFEEAYKALVGKVNDAGHSGAKKFLEGLYEERKKVCFFWTNSIFTCGYCSTQRGEGTNSKLKGGGALKKMLRDSSLVVSVERILALCDRQDAEVAAMLAQHITNKDSLGTAVTNLLQERKGLAMKLSHVEELTNAGDEQSQVFQASQSVDSQGDIHKVRVPRQDGAFPPQCSCGFHTATKLPCEGICIVYNRINRDIDKKHNFSHRFHLDQQWEKLCFLSMSRLMRLYANANPFARKFCCGYGIHRSLVLRWECTILSRYANFVDIPLWVQQLTGLKDLTLLVASIRRPGACESSMARPFLSSASLSQQYLSYLCW